MKKKNILKKPRLTSNHENKITKKEATNADMEEAEVVDAEVEEANEADIEKNVANLFLCV